MSLPDFSHQQYLKKSSSRPSKPSWCFCLQEFAIFRFSWVPSYFFPFCDHKRVVQFEVVTPKNLPSVTPENLQAMSFLCQFLFIRPPQKIAKVGLDSFEKMSTFIKDSPLWMSRWKSGSMVSKWLIPYCKWVIRRIYNPLIPKLLTNTSNLDIKKSRKMHEIFGIPSPIFTQAAMYCHPPPEKLKQPGSPE